MSDDNTKATEWTLLLHTMQGIQVSVSEQAKQQNTMNERLGDIEKKISGERFQLCVIERRDRLWVPWQGEWASRLRCSKCRESIFCGIGDAVEPFVFADSSAAAAGRESRLLVAWASVVEERDDDRQERSTKVP